MQKLPLLALCLQITVLAPAHGASQACLPTPALIALDARYEEALRAGDPAFLQEVLADDYVWVHSLGSSVDTKAALLARAKARPVVFKARTTSDVQAHALGGSVVLRGLSSVEQWNADGKTWRTNRYQFMRTWVNVDGACKLLSVQTMKVWSSDPQ